MSNIMYTEFWPAQHGSQACPFLSVVDWRDAVFACKDQSMYMECSRVKVSFGLRPSNKAVSLSNRGGVHLYELQINMY